MKPKSSVTFLAILLLIGCALEYNSYCEATAASSSSLNPDIHILSNRIRTFSLDNSEDEDDDEEENTKKKKKKKKKKKDNEGFYGIRGISYEHVEEFFYALPPPADEYSTSTTIHDTEHENSTKHHSDEFNEKKGGPPRFYYVTIYHEQVNVEGTIILKDLDENEYEAGDFFPYSIAYGYPNVFIAHRGGSYIEEDGIFVYDYDGYQQGEVPTPSVLNGTLVGLSVREDDDDTLFCFFDVNDGIKRYHQIVPIDVVTGKIGKQYIYETESNHVMLMALDGKGMLALEYVGESIPHEKANVYYASLTEEAEEPNVGSTLNGNRMKKSLLATLNDVPHYESMALRQVGGGENPNRYELVLVTEENNDRVTDVAFVRVWFHHRHSKKSKSEDYPPADNLCINFCDEYWNTCGNQDYFFYDRQHPIQNMNESGLSTGYVHGYTPPANASRIQREKDAAYKECLGECMLFPRPLNPLEYEIPDRLGVNLGGDTLWCRMRYLTLAQKTTDQQDAALYCPQGSPSGGGVCKDVGIDGVTPYEYYRQGASDTRRVGYCEILAEGSIADCSSAGIDDNNLVSALAMIPSSVDMIFMNDNRGITGLKNGTFEHLVCPECILALYIEEASISYVEIGVFDSLLYLEVLNLNQNLIEQLPSGIFDFNQYLKQFSMFQGPNKPGMLTSLPQDLFAFNWELERIILDGHPDLNHIPEGLFDGLYECEMISFKRCGLTNNGIPEGTFDDLLSLLYFDFSTNYLTKLEASWFSSGWGEYLVRVTLNENLIDTVESGTFDTLSSLEFVYLHDNNITFIPEGIFDNNHELLASTL